MSHSIFKSSFWKLVTSSLFVEAEKEVSAHVSKENEFKYQTNEKELLISTQSESCHCSIIVARNRTANSDNHVEIQIRSACVVNNDEFVKANFTLLIGLDRDTGNVL